MLAKHPMGSLKLIYMRKAVLAKLWFITHPHGHTKREDCSPLPSLLQWAEHDGKLGYGFVWTYLSHTVKDMCEPFQYTCACRYLSLIERVKMSSCHEPLQLLWACNSLSAVRWGVSIFRLSRDEEGHYMYKCGWCVIAKGAFREQHSFATASFVHVGEKDFQVGRCCRSTPGEWRH